MIQRGADSEPRHNVPRPIDDNGEVHAALMLCPCVFLWRQHTTTQALLCVETWNMLAQTVRNHLTSRPQTQNLVNQLPQDVIVHTLQSKPRLGAVQNGGHVWRPGQVL